MFMRGRSTFILGIILLFISHLIPGRAAGQDVYPNTELQQKYDAALEEIERLKSALDKAQKTIEQLQQRLENAQAAQPKDSLMAGNTAVVEQRFQDAIADYTQAIEANPQNISAYKNRGVVQQHLGHSQQAIEDFTRVLEFSPQDAGVYNQRGIAYYRLGQSQLAMDDFTQALARNAKLAAAYSNRGIAARQLGDYGQAIADVRQAAELGLELAPRYLEVLQREVRQMQERLQKEGFKPGPPDGIPGPQTIAALRAYQRQHGLADNGRLDAPTKEALGLPNGAADLQQAGSEIPPRFVYQPKPEYPLLARQNGWEGTVTLHVEMLADGTVGEVEIAKSSGYPVLDTAAQEAAKKWKHQPATQNGTPITQRVSLNVNFTLDDQTNDDQTKAEKAKE